MDKSVKEESRIQKIINKITSKQYVVLLILIIIGIGFIAISSGFQEKGLLHHVFRDIGIALLPLSVIAFAYEVILRKEFLKEMRNHVTESIDDAMPSSLKHLRQSGVVDAYPELDIYNLRNHLLNCDANTDIKILDIWFENLYQFEDIFIDLIVRKNCTIKILIWDLRSGDVLKRRAHSLGKGKSETALMNSILENLQTIEHLFYKLKCLNNPKYLENFQVKTYTSFIGISLFGIGYDYYLGFYLQERYSSHGTQFKISGYHRFFYLQIAEHFNKQWEDETNSLYQGGDIVVYETFYKELILARAEDELKNKQKDNNY